MFKAPGTVQSGFPGKAHVLLGELNALVGSIRQDLVLDLGEGTCRPTLTCAPAIEKRCPPPGLSLAPRCMWKPWAASSSFSTWSLPSQRWVGRRRTQAHLFGWRILKFYVPGAWSRRSGCCLWPLDSLPWGFFNAGPRAGAKCSLVTSADKVLSCRFLPTLQ